MKVLLWYWGRKGGGALYTLEMARAIKAQGIDLHLSLSRQSDLFDNFLELDLPGCHVDTYTSKGQFIESCFKLPSIRRNFLNYVRQNSFDIVYSTMHHVWGGFVAAGFRREGIPYVLTVHDALIHPGDSGLLHQPLLDMHIKKANAAISLTDTVKETLLGRGFPRLERVTVIPHGIFPYYVPPGPRFLPLDRAPRVLFYGRISYYKGLHHLLQAWPGVLLKIPNATLEIWGQGDMGKMLRYVKSDPSITLVNRWISEDEIRPIFQECDLCVLPYIEASQSGVVAIALAAGMPVVVSPQPGLIEQIREGGGIIAKSLATADISDAIVALLSNGQRYYNESSLGLDAAKKLDWNVLASSVRSFLEEVSFSHVISKSQRGVT
jgi:glycosyltransferase involved in cell wall biosynthesis